MSFGFIDVQRWLEASQIVPQIHGPRNTNAAQWPAIEFGAATLDSREAGEGILFCAVAGERSHGVEFLEDAFRAGSPAALVEGKASLGDDLMGWVVEVEDAKLALAAMASGWLREFSPRVAAITGSNGKTTTKDLLRAAVADDLAAYASPGNRNSLWGMPLAILGTQTDRELLILEMGASAPGEIARLAQIARPSLACVTNVAPAHLEGFGSVEEVARTKGALLAQLPQDGLGVINADDAFAATMREMCGAGSVKSFGFSANADLRIENVVSSESGMAARIGGCELHLPFFGEVNAYNAAAALLMAEELGIPRATALDRMGSAVLSGHRSQTEDIGGRRVIDDCYNANPVSTTRALESLRTLQGAGSKYCVLGDMGELGNESVAWHRQVLQSANQGIATVITMGAAYREAADSPEFSGVVECFDADAIDLVVARLIAVVQSGDALLLKGSRSAGLERLLVGLRAGWAEPAPAPREKR